MKVCTWVVPWSLGTPLSPRAALSAMQYNRATNERNERVACTWNGAGMLGAFQRRRKNRKDTQVVLSWWPPDDRRR
eukprot:1154476-Pelagomonas_calceolata.AAC.2